MRHWGISLWALAAATPVLAQPADRQDGLLFYLSADKSLTADIAAGDPVPNFRSAVTITPDGATGGAARWADEGYVAWNAPGNMRAERGTLAFFWRARTPLGEAPFVLFRAGFADHSSWDMAFLRIDWNGHGFDAFVTDANLSRIRVSFRLDRVPAAEEWQHLAFAWDETQGVRLFWNGREVARRNQVADLDSGLDQFGMAGRVISPHQVQSRYNFMRGSDLDEIRIYDRMLGTADVAALAAHSLPGASPSRDTVAERTAWLHRYGWDKGAPPVLAAPVTRVRKIEFADARDLKQWMWKGVDGIAETTWPGVYNRSRLPGRDDYFELPDWNTYVEGGKAYTLTVPAGETFNRVEIRGAAYGALAWSADGAAFARVAERAQGVVRSVDALPERKGGVLRFTNRMQEQPIQELWAYQVDGTAEPEGSFKLSYRVNAKAAANLAALDALNRHIAGRFAPDERSTVLAMPKAGVRAAIGAGAAGDSGAAVRPANPKPIVHILIPSNLNQAPPDQPLARAFNYGWRNLHDGLDGLAIDLPALHARPDAAGLIPLNIRVHDPIWPQRDLIDLSVSVRPGEARTLWLDLRDRILSDDSLFLTIASAAPDFDADALDGTEIRLVFKPRAEALKEHVADRFHQVKDNWGFLVEEHTSSERAALYRRVRTDASDLLRVYPDNAAMRAYWADIDYRPENMPVEPLPPIPAGVPAWAARQLQDLALTRRFVEWWIDNRQVPYGDFGGGISDDSDLVQQWPGLALMGVIPDKVNASLRALDDAAYRNGMIVDGLGYITTDELHAYEEGLNADAARLYLNWGEPKTVERLFATTRALGTVILPNSAGHLHFASNWYGARKMYREGAFEWQKPYSYVVMHAPILLGVFNAAPPARQLVTGLADGWLAHGEQGGDGRWRFPNEINWRTDATRAGDGGGVSTPLQTVWSAWRFTGDMRYLRPLQARPGAVGEINENGALLPETRAMVAAKGDVEAARIAAWTRSGDPAPLAALHEAAIREKSARLSMMTEGHWWTDRVESENQWLQRERLGGIALRRNQTYPGHAVSWRFARDAAAEQVALLVPGATPAGFTVEAFNTSAVPQDAVMTTWNVTAGRWTMRSPDGSVRTLDLGRSRGVALRFAPGASRWVFALEKAGEPVELRPDLGIGRDDVVVEGRTVTVTVHSLGHAPTGGGTVIVSGAAGELGRAPLPALEAPTDLRPRTATVRVRLTGTAMPETVRVELPGEAPEVTLHNNQVRLAPGS
ncbi:LamG-like jellyroll fold domain-containing protein [Sphingomonas azotifigens]|uniref:LamG-like jellyroll fold domain-containing protein n=1 Tax=Sphingomonas azotifigens TaxID=330920 RepID=UPI000A0034EC|nr:LamG-like jellyroll fold domain-containing protein [Sphingomonas azotifigens]